MNWIVWAIFIFLLFAVIILGVLILSSQKALDAPERGMLLVDKQDEEGPAMVYLQAFVDPGTFKNGETIKLRVRVIPPESQGKQVRV